MTSKLKNAVKVTEKAVFVKVPKVRTWYQFNAQRQLRHSQVDFLNSIKPCVSYLIHEFVGPLHLKTWAKCC